MNLSLRLKEYFNLLVFSKKIFCKPEKKDILIFDSELSEFLIHYFNKEKVHVLDNRYKQHRNQKLNIFILFKMAIKFKFNSYEYFKTYLNYVRPKLILTLIDNNKTFYKLKEMYPKAKTMLVQNAWRSADGDDIFKNMDELLADKLKCDLILSFNNHVGKIFKSFLHGEIVPIGSFRSNHNIKKNLKEKYEYLFISIFRDPNVMHECHFDLLRTINKFFSQKKGKLFILGSIPNPKKEKEFYDKYLNDTNYTLIPRKKERPTYDIVDQSKIILTVESTLGYEAMARGKKVAYFSLRKNIHPDNTANFGWPAIKKANGPFWVNASDITTFKNLLNYLENINEEDYLKVLKQHSSDLIEYDEGNNKFKNLIHSLLRT